jgi:hypothetical protein
MAVTIIYDLWEKTQKELRDEGGMRGLVEQAQGQLGQ